MLSRDSNKLNKRPLVDITNNYAKSSANSIHFQSKKPLSSSNNDNSSLTSAATKVRRTVATKAVSAKNSHARRAKAVQLANAVYKDVPGFNSYPSDTTSLRSGTTTTTTTGASPMSTTAIEPSFKPLKRPHGKLSQGLALKLSQLVESSSQDEPEIVSDFLCCGAPLPVGIDDIDMEDHDFHLRQSRFAVEIYRNLRKTESSFMASAQYMNGQEDITAKMRAILIDWLVDVHNNFKLQAETLFLTVNIIDRFLERQSVPRRKLQLVGITAMLIACKYEQIYAPITKDFVYISDNAYTEEEILKMESVILNELEFLVTVPSSLKFVRRSLKAVKYSTKYSSTRTENQVEHLAEYSLELAMQDMKMLTYKPSEQAAAAVLLANRLVHGEERWTPSVAYHSGGYDVSLLSDCENDLLRLLVHERDPLSTNKLKAIKRKYSDEKYSEISTHVANMELESNMRCTSMEIS